MANALIGGLTTYFSSCSATPARFVAFFHMSSEVLPAPFRRIVQGRCVHCKSVHANLDRGIVQQMAARVDQSVMRWVVSFHSTCQICGCAFVLTAL